MKHGNTMPLKLQPVSASNTCIITLRIHCCHLRRGHHK